MNIEMYQLGMLAIVPALLAAAVPTSASAEWCGSEQKPTVELLGNQTATAGGRLRRHAVPARELTSAERSEFDTVMEEMRFRLANEDSTCGHVPIPPGDTYLCVSGHVYTQAGCIQQQHGIVLL